MFYVFNLAIGFLCRRGTQQYVFFTCVLLMEFLFNFLLIKGVIKIMICDSFHRTPSGETVCWGTKECEKCYCEGNKSNCTFYPEKRKPDTLNTAEMWLKAQTDGKTYQSGDVLYSKKTGLIDMEIPDRAWGIAAWAANKDDIEGQKHELDDLMNEKWVEYDMPTMKREKAEVLLGVKIID